MSEFSKLFSSDRDPVIIRTFTVVEKDYELIKKVFPESGFLQHMPGLFFKLLANELRNRNIQNATDRLYYPELATVPGLVSDLNLAFDPTRRRHVGFGVGNVRKEPAGLQRILADIAQSSPEGKRRQANQERKESREQD